MSIPTLEPVAADSVSAADTTRDGAISVVHTGDKHLLINVPRSIAELSAATRPRPQGLRQRVAHFLGFYPQI